MTTLDSTIFDEPEDFSFSEEEELSYAEILAATVFNSEIVITILLEDEARVKQGLKNFKSKQATKAKDSGEPIDSAVLNFTSQPSLEFPGYIDLHILSKTRGTVKIKQLRIPENDLPD